MSDEEPFEIGAHQLADAGASLQFGLAPPDQRSSEHDVASSGMPVVLLEARTRALVRFTEISAEFDEIVRASDRANTDDEHDPEGATIAFERARAASLRSQAESDLHAIKDAITRWQNGSFGTCEACGRAIPAERLAALPMTRTCVTCAGSR